jgi:spore germination protein GerM
MLVAAAACGGSDSSRSGDEVPTTAGLTTTAAPPPTTDPAGVAAVQMYFLRDGVLTRGEARLVPGPDLARRALETLMAGPTEADTAAGLYSGIEPRVSLLSFSIEGANATVDFNRPFETRDTQPQVGQVVYTLTQFAGLATVTFLIDGEPNGATGVRPLGRADVRDDLGVPG